MFLSGLFIIRNVSVLNFLFSSIAVYANDIYTRVFLLLLDVFLAIVTLVKIMYYTGVN